MTTHDPIPARLAALKTTTTPDLKKQWRELFDSEPPPFNRRYLESRLAYRIQELAYGGLKPETIRRLERLGEELDGGDKKKRGMRLDRDRPITGTRLLREWQGVEYIVTVTADGFEWQGRPYKSLSAIARAITGILQESPRKRAARTRADTPALLKGLLFGPDGAAFSPTHTRKGGRLYRYYVSQTVLKHGAGACTIGRVPAGEIEAAVIDQLRAVFRQPEIVAGTWKAARTQGDGITEADARTALQKLDPLWDELFPGEQARIVMLLVERVEIGSSGLNLRLRMDGLAALAREITADAGAEV